MSRHSAIALAFLFGLAANGAGDDSGTTTAPVTQPYTLDMKGDPMMRGGLPKRAAWEESPVQPPEIEIKPTPDRDTLLYITPKWMLWQTHELLGSPLPRVLQYRLRHYLQKRGEERARLVLNTTGQLGVSAATVLDDGTVVFGVGAGGLAWIPPDYQDPATPRRLDTKTLKLDGEETRAVAMYPDGLVMRSQRIPYPAWFVPIRDGQLVLDGRVAVTGGRGFNAYRETILRHGNELALFGGEVPLTVVNLRTGERAEHKTIPPIGHGGPYAFDGETLATSLCYCDVRTGAILRMNPGYFVLAVRNRIGYFLRQAYNSEDPPQFRTQLVAVDLDPKRERTAVLAEVADPARYRYSGPSYMYSGQTDVLFASEPEGLTLWNGKAWQQVKWLERTDVRLQSARPRVGRRPELKPPLPADRPSAALQDAPPEP